MSGAYQESKLASGTPYQKLEHTFPTAPSALTALFALLNVASDVITFNRATWHSYPAPHASLQFCASAPNLNPVRRAALHTGVAATSLIAPGAHTQAAAPSDVTGLEGSTPAGMVVVTWRSRPQEAHTAAAVGDDVSFQKVAGHMSVVASGTGLRQRPDAASNTVPPAQSDATTGHSVLGFSPGAVQQQSREWAMYDAEHVDEADPW